MGRCTFSTEMVTALDITRNVHFFFLLFGNVLLHTDMVLLVFLKNNLSGFTVQSNSFVYMFLMLNQALY